jgi:hypothetical protein
MTAFGSGPSGNVVALDGVLWYRNVANVLCASSDGISTTRPVTITRAFTGDPMFSADGYHLTFRSAAIDKGVDTAPSVDIDGDARPTGCCPDLGADEFAVHGGARIYLPFVLR